MDPSRPSPALRSDLLGSCVRLRNGQILPMAGLAVAIGLAAGLAAVAFRWLLFELGDFFFVTVARLLSFLGDYHVVILPALGALAAGVLVALLAPETRGAGVTDVMLAVLSQGSRIRTRVAGVRMVGTSLTIGSGGSGGIEGPTVQIGGCLGSAIGQWARLPEDRLRITLASGSAAAVAATFNMPLAGLLFAHEVILGGIGWGSFATVALATTVANGVARLALGANPMLGLHSHSLVHPIELLLYLLLAAAAASVGVLFTHTFDRFDLTFARWSFPSHLKPAAAGFLVGLLGLFFPRVLGLGYETIGATLAGQLPLALMATLVVVKLVATSLTVGSGAPGGLIGPSLYLGAVLGGSAGVLFHTLLPEATAPPGAYALVGMASVFAATFHAPLTASFTAFELTGDLGLLPFLVMAGAASSYLARRISPHTIYSASLSRRGIDAPRRATPVSQVR